MPGGASIRQTLVSAEPRRGLASAVNVTPFISCDGASAPVITAIVVVPFAVLMVNPVDLIRTPSQKVNLFDHIGQSSRTATVPPCRVRGRLSRAGRDRGSPRRRRGRGEGPRLSQQVFVLYAAIMLLVAGSGVIVALVAADRLVRQGAEDRVLSMARAVAATPDVQEALTGPDPTQRLQPLAERLRQARERLVRCGDVARGIRTAIPTPR